MILYIECIIFMFVFALDYGILPFTTSHINTFSCEKFPHCFTLLKVVNLSEFLLFLEQYKLLPNDSKFDEISSYQQSANSIIDWEEVIVPNLPL